MILYFIAVSISEIKVSEFQVDTVDDYYVHTFNDGSGVRRFPKALENKVMSDNLYRTTCYTTNRKMIAKNIEDLKNKMIDQHLTQIIHCSDNIARIKRLKYNA